MFSDFLNKNHNQPGIPYAKNVTINEHRAPTDKSVQLLNEMQDKARKNIIQSVKIESNVCTAIVICFSDDVMRNRLNWLLRFKLNEKEYILEDYFEDEKLGQYRYSEFDFFDPRMIHFKSLIVKRLAEKISSIITDKVSADIMNMSKQIHDKL